MLIFDTTGLQIYFSKIFNIIFKNAFMVDQNFVRKNEKVSLT